VNRKYSWENRTEYQVMNEMARYAHEIARCTNIQFRYTVLISRKVWYLATLCFQRCHILQLLLYQSTTSMTCRF